MDYLAMTLVELHKCLVNKEITPVELVKLALDELHASPDNAVETFNDEEALKEASLEELQKYVPLEVALNIQEYFKNKEENL